MLLTSNHPLIVFSREFHDVCKPLELLHIEHFTYQKQFNDGTRMSLSTKPQWVADYYNLKLYESSLFEKKPSTYKADFHVWADLYDLEVYRYGRNVYNTADTISITEPNLDGCEHFLFSATPEKAYAIQYLVDNISILYRFILYLKDKGLVLFKDAQKHRIKIQTSFLESESPDDIINLNQFYNEMDKTKADFLNKTPITRYIVQSVNSDKIKLTQQEIACVTHLLKNKTAKETAKILKISPRTVETYLDSIKIKLQCETKVELVKRLIRDKYLSSLLE